jgi:hypothetical protein
MCIITFIMNKSCANGNTWNWKYIKARLVGPSVKLLPSPAQSFLASALVEIYEQDFCSVLYMYMLRNGASSLMRGGVLSVEALLLLHHSFSTSISALSQRPGHCPWLAWLLNWLTTKLLLALGSTVILGTKSRGTHHHNLLSDGSGSFIYRLCLTSKHDATMHYL